MVETQKKAMPRLVTIQAELFGLARLLCARRQVQITVPAQATTSHLVAALATACPQLVGQAILEDRSGLEESYTFNLNGTAFLSDQQLDLKPGDKVLLFSSQAGG